MAAWLRSRKHTYSSSSYTIAACSSLVDMRQNTHLLSVDEALVSFVSTTSGPLSLAIDEASLCERAHARDYRSSAPCCYQQPIYTDSVTESGLAKCWLTLG